MDSSQDAGGMAELVGLVTRNVLQQLQTGHVRQCPSLGLPTGYGRSG